MTAYFKKGFTLIELLIVIAVLGILAVAVISAINPIEQINRSRDTGGRSDAEQLIGAIDRFYATQGYYSWQTGATDTAHVALDWVGVGSTWVDNGGDGVLAKLAETGTGELKSSFTNRISATTYNTLYIYNTGTAGSSTYVCFQTKSKAFETEAKNRCEATGDLPSDFPSTNACNVTVGGKSGVYYSCLP
jgi:prepilin-type N-terminal cleavage/methylation domain-containing protein